MEIKMLNYDLIVNNLVWIKKKNVENGLDHCLPCCLNQ